jgi:DNA polymerase-3 subunit alpha
MGYVQAYLKCYYPLEFWTATLNTIDRGLEKHGQSSLGKYINSIYNAGLEVLPPDVNHSGFMFESTKSNKIPFALSYIKDVSKGAEDVVKGRPYKDWEDFLEKSIKLKINKRVVRGLIFSGALDFDDDIETRPYKWLLYLARKGTKKTKSGERLDRKYKEEIDEIQSNMPEMYNLIEMEYDYCKFSFTGIDKYLQSRPELKNLQTVSERDKHKKLWVLAGYISDISKKKSKKSGNEYVLVTVTDFRDSISVFGFGDKYKNKVLANFHKGQLVKIGVKNDSNWLKLPWESEYAGKFPIQVIS